MHETVADFTVTAKADSSPQQVALVPFEERAEREYHSNHPILPARALPELLIRAGTPESFETDAFGYQLAVYKIQISHPQFVPGAHALESPFDAQSSDWDLAASFPWEWMESRYGVFVPLDFQMARFRRGDSTRLVAATDVSADERFRGKLIAGALAFSTGPKTPAIVHRQDSALRYVFSPFVPTDSAIVGLEVESENSAVGWVRFGFAPLVGSLTTLRISDVALYDPGAGSDAEPADLEALLERIRPNTTLKQGSTVGLFWEMYGLKAGDSTSFTLSAQRVDGPNVATSAVRRLFGTAVNPVPLRLSWTDVRSAGRAVEPRTLAVDLGAFEPGRYLLRLTATIPGRLPATAEREIVIAK
jgi:hypothetical protein